MNSLRKLQHQLRFRSLSSNQDCGHPSYCPCSLPTELPLEDAPSFLGLLQHSFECWPRFPQFQHTIASLLLSLLLPFALLSRSLPLLLTCCHCFPLPHATISFRRKPPGCGDPLDVGSTSVSSVLTQRSDFFSQESVRRRPHANRLHVFLEIFG